MWTCSSSKPKHLWVQESEFLFQICKLPTTRTCWGGFPLTAASNISAPEQPPEVRCCLCRKPRMLISTNALHYLSSLMLSEHAQDIKLPVFIYIYINSSESSRVKHQHRKKNEKNINLTWSSDLKSFAFLTIPQPKRNVSALEHRVFLGNSPWHTPLSCSLVDREDASAASAWIGWWLVSTVSYHQMLPIFQYPLYIPHKKK